MKGLLALYAALAFPGAGCSTHQPISDNLELYVSASSYDFRESPELLERVVASPYGYFRFINQRFAQSVCVRFAKDLASMPKVNLHGDAHVTQYTVTESGRGLADFDDASMGPAILDLIRFGVSIELVAELKQWLDEKPGMVDAFLNGYRAALRDPETIAQPPQVVEHVRAEFGSDRRPLLAWADALMDPERLMPAPVQRMIEPFASAMYEQDPDLSPTYFAVKKAGRHRLGVGSALDEKYLIRVEGPTLVPEDDVLVEVKQIRDLSAIDCVERRPRDPEPILNAQSRIAYQPHRFTGFLHLDDRSFWLHTWVDHYYEISEKDLRTPDELTEIVFDVGVQLGRGHPKDITPDDARLRQAELESLDRQEANIKRAIAELAAETVRAWERFRVEATR